MLNILRFSFSKTFRIYKGHLIPKPPEIVKGNEHRQYNKNWIEKLKTAPTTYQRFVRVRLAEIKRSGFSSLDAYKKTLSQWKQLSAEQKKKYEPDYNHFKKDLESLNDYKIPDLRMELRLGKNSQSINKFCQKHQITVNELQQLIAQVNKKKADKENEKLAKKMRAMAIEKMETIKNQNSEGKSERSSQQPSTTKASSSTQSTNQRDQIRSTLHEFKEMR